MAICVLRGVNSLPWVTFLNSSGYGGEEEDLPVPWESNNSNLN